MSIPISFIASTASGFNPFGSTPALNGSNSSPATWRRYPSAIWLRAELPVQRKRTFGLDTGVLRHWRATARRTAGSARRFSLLLRQIVFENDEHFPLIAIRIMHPSLILRRIAAVGLHLVASHQPGVRPFLSNAQDILRQTDLNAHVRKRPSVFERNFIQREIERRVLDIELRIACPDFARLNPKHLAVKLGAPRHIPHMDGNVRLQGNHSLCRHDSSHSYSQ